MKALAYIESVFGEPSGLYGEPKGRKEHIVAAAVRLVDGDIFIADDHGYCWDLILKHLGHLPFFGEEGFYTNKGRFLDRKDALQLGAKTGQGTAAEEDNEFEYEDGHSHHFYARESIDHLFEGYVELYYGYWVSRDGKFTPVEFEQHGATAEEILGASDTGAPVYNQMYDLGYLHVVNYDTDRTTVVVGNDLSNAQRRELMDYAIEHRRRLLWERRGSTTAPFAKVLYDPRDTASITEPAEMAEGLMEAPEVAIDNRSKKAIALAGNDIKYLHDMPLEDMRENIVIIRQPEGSRPHPLIDVGSTWVYFMDSPESAKAMKEGKIPYLMVPVGTFYGGGNPITDVWKKRFAKPGTEHILGLLQGHSDENRIYIDMMSVRTSWRRNRINTLMIDALRNEYPNAKLTYSSPTDVGQKFISKYSTPPAPLAKDLAWKRRAERIQKRDAEERAGKVQLKGFSGVS